MDDYWGSANIAGSGGAEPGSKDSLRAAATESDDIEMIE
jgi:hypothetical protein